MTSNLIEIDGSILEGGGQILRVALAISALKRIPIKIINIRAGRSKPGLMEQHLKGLQLIRDISNAKTKGDSLHSIEVEFWPGEIKGGNYKALVRTAGSISLLLQAALPCILFSDFPTTLTLQGGTNAEMAPQIDYTTEVFKPNMERFGATFDFDLIKRGYFPKGGGEVVINVDPVKELKGIELLEFGEITAVYGWSFVAGSLPLKLAHLMADSACNTLNSVFRNIKIERYKEDRNMAPDNASGIILVAETSTGCVLGSSALGKRGESSEETGKRAANDLLNDIDKQVCVDAHCQDQIIILMALAKTPSQVKVGELTMHTKTAIYILEKLTNVKFEIIPSGSANIIKCLGDK